MTGNEGPILYRIDARDQIVFVNDGWDAFAFSNDAPEMAARNVLDRDLWDFVSGATLRHLYQLILQRVRNGDSLKFDLRCDSPGLRRFLDIFITPLENGFVQFETRTLRTEKRDTQKLFTKHRSLSGIQLQMCSWCNKIKVGGELWLEIEQAIKALGLFEEEEEAPDVSHGICQPCCNAVLRQTQA
jgi:hypothetical protein